MQWLAKPSTLALCYWNSLNKEYRYLVLFVMLRMVIKNLSSSTAGCFPTFVGHKPFVS